MRAGKERLRAEAFGITVLHWIPAGSVLISTHEAFLQSRFAGKVTLTSILVEDAAFFKILMISVLSAQHKLEVDILIKLSIHCTLIANHSFCAWAARVSCNLLQVFVALDFDPAASTQSPAHRRIPNLNTEVLFAFLWDEMLIERSGLGCPRTRVLVIHHVFWIIAPAAVTTVSIKSLVNLIAIVTIPRVLKVVTTLQWHRVAWI